MESLVKNLVNALGKDKYDYDYDNQCDLWVVFNKSRKDSEGFLTEALTLKLIQEPDTPIKLEYIRERADHYAVLYHNSLLSHHLNTNRLMEIFIDNQNKR